MADLKKLPDKLTEIESRLRQVSVQPKKRILARAGDNLNLNRIDRFTSVDELLLIQIDESRKTRALLTEIAAGIGALRQPIDIRQDKYSPVVAERLERLVQLQEAKSVSTEPVRDYNFIYPPDGSKKTVDAGRTIIDFYQGVVKLPNGTEEYMSDSLRKHMLEPGSVRSVAISTSQASRYGLDNMGLKPIDATDFQTERKQSFTVLQLETTMQTQITVWASTNPDAFFGKIGASTTGGVINTYGVAVDILSEYGAPAGTIGYYSGNLTTYQTLATVTVGSGKYGDLYEIGMTPDTNAWFKVSIGGTALFEDIKLLNPVALTFPPNKLAAGTVILVQVKSINGTAIEVNGSITMKEVST